MPLVKLLRALKARERLGRKQGYIIVSQPEFNAYAKVFGNMGDSNLVVAHNGRKSLTYNGIELRVI